MVGLDNSGKSTIIQCIKPKKSNMEVIVPTVGYNFDQFSKGNIEFSVMDMSGSDKYRDLWIDSANGCNVTFIDEQRESYL